MSKMLRPAISLFFLFTLLTGVAYPLVVTGVGQAAFPGAANGSAILRNGKVVGSALIGQSFTRADYFWGRPSAAGDGYNARASSGSNLGPNSQALADRISKEAQRYDAPVAQIPVDLLTASGSGLDPHISVDAARFQVARVAQARKLPVGDVARLVDDHIENPIADVIGEPRVNVLNLNLALDSLSEKASK
jgi:potassium-transporting ATPase KdpC subunit